MLVTPQNCTKMLRNLTFVSYTICSLQILASDQNKFLLFWATFEQLSFTKTHFWLFFEQRFEKLRETFWKISSNLWKALAEVPNYPLFFSGDLPTKRRLPLPRNSLRLVASSTTPQPPSVQHCQPPVSSKVLSISFFFSFLFFLSLFSVSNFHIARLYFAPANFEPDAM